jgi:ubiquinone/menaquinone biosynthesis C-methylase UbiE
MKLLRTNRKKQSKIGNLREHSIINYKNYISELLVNMPEEQAMMYAIGAANKDSFVSFGNIQVQVLKFYGLQNGMTIYDLGCGSGRTAQALSRANWTGNYLGHDVDERLISFLNAHSGGFKSTTHTELSVLAESATIDLVFHWSVFTHLFLEEIYIYLEEIFRVLKPGGRHVFSFLNLENSEHFDSIFLSRVKAFKDQTNLPVLDTFMNQNEIKLLLEKIGFKDIYFESGNDSKNHPAFGQDIVSMRK